MNIDSLLKIWDQFKKQPIIAMLFACTLGLGYVYMDLKKETKENKVTQTKLNEDCRGRVTHLENSITFMQHEKRITDSSLNALNTQWKLMQKLGLIKLPD